MKMQRTTTLTPRQQESWFIVASRSLRRFRLRPAGACRTAPNKAAVSSVSFVSAAPLGIAPRLTSAEVDVLRVRALQGDSLAEVRDATREWVFRSVLKGRHLEEWAAQAGLDDQQAVDKALARIRWWYQHRLDHYKQSVHSS